MMDCDTAGIATAQLQHSALLTWSEHVVTGAKLPQNSLGPWGQTKMRTMCTQGEKGH